MSEIFQSKRTVNKLQIEWPECRVNPIAIVLFILTAGPGAWLGVNAGSPAITVSSLILASLVSASLKIATQWEKAVVLRLGRFHRLAGPGPFFIIPLVDTVSNWVDQRVMATSFNRQNPAFGNAGRKGPPGQRTPQGD